MQGNQVFSQLWRIMRGIMAEIQPALEEAKLSVRSFFLLTKVEEFPYPAQLAEQLLLPPPTISLHLRELEQLNYLSRQPDQKDLRRFHLALTDQGQKVLSEMQANIDKIVGDKCEFINKTDQLKFEQIISTLELELSQS